VSTPGARGAKFELTRGESVGKYEILRKIATGGMAELYLARVRGAAGFEKVVVLKRILPGIAEDPDFVQMFLDEARLAATLQHPNIADVHDVGEADGQYFFTMEFVYGQDARTIRHEMKKRNEPVPLAASLAIMHGTAAALDYAHERRGPDGHPMGLVHRDVSAANIMVSYDGAVKLLDFGIARVMTASHRTQVGTLKGKVPYMSPEQCKGQPLDRRSDLFSLGIVLFELTVGRRPFRGDSDYAVMDQIVYHGAPRPSSLVSGYPPELEAIVMKLLEREPKARYTTADELGDDLDAFIQRHGLWLSPKQLGKYMRTVFADRIAAWHEAEKHGVSFTEHVAESLTAQSQQSELMTPPTAYPALERRPSSPEIAAALRPAGESWEAPTDSFRKEAATHNFRKVRGDELDEVAVVRPVAGIAGRESRVPALPLPPPPAMTPPVGIPLTPMPPARGTPTPPGLRRAPTDPLTPPTIPDAGFAPPPPHFESEQVPTLRPRSSWIALALIIAIVLGAIILAVAMF
jgi:serine/threonine protein kinase